jgi:hypothetical protein
MNDDNGRFAIFSLVVIVLAVVGTMCWNLYRAGVQQEVYRRQGVEMTRWEIFIGMKTAERTINLK